MSIVASVFSFNRRFVDTYVETTATADDGKVLLTERVPFVPMKEVERHDWTCAIDTNDVLRHRSISARLRGGVLVRITWRVRLSDDHGHVLDTASFTSTYGWVRAA